MAYRVATSMKTSNHQSYLRQLEVKKFQLQNRVAGEQKNLSLADNPSGSALASKYRSDLTRIEGYQTNIDRVKGENQLIHNQLQELSNVMIRAKELTVQAAHGTYNPDDLKHSAKEMDQLIHHMMDIANMTDENGNALFAGTEKMNRAFEGYMGRVPGGKEPMVVQVNYLGNHLASEIAIDQGKTVDVERAGSRLFWGSPESLYSGVNGAQYRVLQDTSVVVNGQQISLRAGDNIHSIVARINSATVAVNAEVDHNDALVLHGNRSEQLVLQDGPGGSVLRDLGLIVDGSTPPYNVSPYAQREGGNLFNQLIDVRNMMLKGDTESIGSRGLRAVENAHGSLVNNLSSIGAQSARLDAMTSALGTREMNIAQSNVQESVLTDMDRTELLLEYKELDNVHTATLQSAAKALRPSLLDFLR